MRERAHLGVQLKEDGSLVTHADRAIERMLREALVELVPGSTVWGEEEGFSEPGEAGLWAVDPIDGTSNYRFGSPHWGISAGLIRGNEVEMGVVVLPDLGWVFAGERGRGATWNGKPMTMLAPGPIRQEELVSYGDLTLTRYGGGLPGKMRYLGAFVADAAMFLTGVYRALLSDKAALYDAAATICIAREIGADVRFTDGEALDLRALMNVRPFPKSVGFLPPESGFRL